MMLWRSLARIIGYTGKFGDTGCNQTTVTIPNPPFSPSYRFTICFPNNVPTTNCPIVLTGVNPQQPVKEAAADACRVVAPGAKTGEKALNE
jgi:hypothetical protein